MEKLEKQLHNILRTGSYDSQDGTKKYTTDIVVENFEFIGNSNNNSNNTQIDDAGFGDMTPVDDGDTPF